MFQKSVYSFLYIVLFLGSAFAQKEKNVSNRNIGILISSSVLEGPGYRCETPAFFYSSKRHGFSVAASLKFDAGKSVAFGTTMAYFLFIEPAFRDISFYFNYNASTFHEADPSLTHIFGGGVQIDLFKRFFMHHSVGLGFRQSLSNFSVINTCGQIKISIGFYLREIPVVHIHDNWEKSE